MSVLVASEYLPVLYPKCRTMTSLKRHFLNLDVFFQKMQGCKLMPSKVLEVWHRYLSVVLFDVGIEQIREGKVSAPSPSPTHSQLGRY